MKEKQATRNSGRIIELLPILAIVSCISGSTIGLVNPICFHLYGIHLKEASFFQCGASFLLSLGGGIIMTIICIIALFSITFIILGITSLISWIKKHWHGKSKKNEKFAPKNKVAPLRPWTDKEWEQHEEAAKIAFEHEIMLFNEILPSLLTRYKGKYVAMLDGKVIDSDEDEIELTKRMIKKYPYHFVLVRLVTDQPFAPDRM